MYHPDVPQTGDIGKFQERRELRLDSQRNRGHGRSLEGQATDFDLKMGNIMIDIVRYSRKAVDT